MSEYNSFYDSKHDMIVQLKVGNFSKTNNYEIGDSVKDNSIEDGIYIGYEGIVVIENSIVIVISKNLFTKWGDKVSLNELEKWLDKFNPFIKAIAEYGTNAKLNKEEIKNEKSKEK